MLSKLKKNDQYKVIKSFESEVIASISKPLKFGIILVLIFVVGFGGWGLFARIDKAAIAVGEIVPGGNNRVVQHLEGGVIEEILVKEGDVVEKGEVLIKLSKSSAGANVEIYETALNTSVAEYARLVAERDSKDKVTYPAKWSEDPEKYKEYVETQNQIFRERVTAYKGKVDILNERSNQLQSEISGMKSQLQSTYQQMNYADKEIEAVEKLLASGNTTMSRLLALKTRRSEIEGRIGELKSSIAKGEQAISENKLNIINLKNETQNEVAEKIKEIQAKVNELKERGGSASDVLSRTEIRAPAAGIVKDLKFKTAGSSGVIPPNGEVLTIVPSGEDMIADVKISPNDIDVVRKPNLKTRIRLSAYSARHIPMLQGVLTYVSADSFKDQQTQQNFYKGRVSIDISPLKKILASKPEVDHEAYLYPGMPVEVYIVTGERSPISYLVDPLRNDLRKSMREE